MIEIKELTKIYDNKVIFDHFNLRINKGDFFIISGVSGKGKTTLLNIIGGLEKAEKGIVLVKGQDVLKMKNKRKYFGQVVGFLFQNFVLLENKTVYDNLKLIKKENRSDISMEKALDLVGMKDSINRKIYTLSGGEQQRIALARLLLKKCDVVLADEPTGSLDKTNKFIVMNLLKKMNKMGKTIIMVTHDEELIQKGNKVLEL
ncbi:MAG: ATP-binding cassette domain-containing protein [Lachnospiraceae bacterium]|nr:ATP-binding cassette domain-containing protein [Lachnospiraceae bacterium]